jgi:microsomal epoxide hydrolase
LADDRAVTPFEVAVPDHELDDLERRLARTRWPDQFGDPWQYGTDLAYLRALCEYWRDGFDWRTQEGILNRYPQYLVEVEEGYRLHCSVARGTAGRPLLLLSGWPSTIYEHTKVTERLVGDFDVVRVSLPGFGFSDRYPRPGMNPRRAAGLLVRVMEELGYPRFCIHATDFGQWVASFIGLDHGERVMGLHMTTVPRIVDDGPVFRGMSTRTIGGGYQAVQSTVPQTMAQILTDSPAGLASWIADKWRTWSDCAGELESVFTKDELLTTIAIYWFTSTLGSSARFYYETRVADVGCGPSDRIEVPTGFSLCPVPPPRELKGIERRFDVRYWNELPRGGHFPTMEEPELLETEIRTFFSQVATV